MMKNVGPTLHQVRQMGEHIWSYSPGTCKQFHLNKPRSRKYKESMMTSDITTLDSMGRAEYKIMNQFPFRKQPRFPFLESLLSILTEAHSLQHTRETLTDNFCLFFCNWSCSNDLQCATTNILFQGSLV